MFSSLLLSCGSSTGTPLESADYQEEVIQSSTVFKVLQISDVHASYLTDMGEVKSYLKVLTEEADPDMLMLTGDIFFNATEQICDAFFGALESIGIPYAFVFGNHDYQGLYSKKYIYHRLGKSDLSYFVNIDDNVYGNSNYVLNIKRNGKILWQLYCLDSGSTYNNNGKYGYDYIRDDQVDWFAAQSEAAKTYNNGSYVPSLAFFHIPLQEWILAHDANPSGILGEIKEKDAWSSPDVDNGKLQPFSPSKVHSKLFEEAKLRNVKGMFCGHDHANDWVSTYEGVVLGYGVKTTRGLYYGTSSEGYDITGGSLMTLKSDGTFDLEHIYVQTGDLSIHTKEVQGL